MPQQLRSISGAKHLKPLEQGDLDSLCGLYAIINAVRVATYPVREFNRMELGRLFNRGIAALSSLRQLKMVLTVGMDDDVWILACKAITDEASVLFPGTFSCRRPIVAAGGWKAQDVIRHLKRSVDAACPAIVVLGGRLEHWTVVAGYSATRFNLFDSIGYNWILKTSIVGDEKLIVKPHRITSTMMITLTYAAA